MPGAVNDLDYYKRVCSQIDRFADRTTKSFDLFIKLSLATIGGYTWLKTHQDPNNLVWLVPWVILALAIATAIELLSDLHSWWGFRKKESRLLGDANIEPRLFPTASGRLEFIRIAIMAFGTWAAFKWLH